MRFSLFLKAGACVLCILGGQGRFKTSQPLPTVAGGPLHSTESLAARLRTEGTVGSVSWHLSARLSPQAHCPPRALLREQPRLSSS